jgi:hypothetical protein
MKEAADQRSTVPNVGWASPAVLSAKGLHHEIASLAIAWTLSPLALSSLCFIQVTGWSLENGGQWII